ncbi:hypothetical protein SAMN04488107_3045 [Geodermatophilus saharensis]|uniref:Flagellar biosynthetic protein FliP n=1 Tax=Geodermatophilus saharensis TaxID=1137994 RepID=A0A239FIK3_9ACTN|nr:hypothetical protein [Geodermatophilus saharensis]SNS56796.1 hypothetical protein SAMN04488107_3045 [Geodermatophilus saharensis]
MSTPTPTRDTPTAPAHVPHRLSARRFTRHFLEMVVAMAVGMVALHPVWTLALDAVGAPWLMSNPYTGALVMATDMTVAMSAWMRVRGHRWRPIAEMGAAMYLPFLVLFVPLALGLIGEGALLLWGHVLMLPAMAAAMLLRPAEYASC